MEFIEFCQRKMRRTKKKNSRGRKKSLSKKYRINRDSVYDDNYTRFDIMNYLACSNTCAFTQIFSTTIDSHRVTLYA